MKAIAAVDKFWGIGKGGSMLFRLPLDLKFFRRETLGGAVVMGRKTLESLPGGPLPGRLNIVLTSQDRPDKQGVIYVKNMRELFGELAKHEKVFVIGGGEVYRALLPYCSEALITKIDADGGAEVFFDDLDALPGWQCIEESGEIIDNGYSTRRCLYKNTAVKEF